MKIRARVKRRKNGKFQAVIENGQGGVVWACPHDHTYGTSNRSKQDSASKCGFAEVKRRRAML